jgi:hypothetical protein
LARQATWTCQQFTVELPYRPDLPGLEETRQKLAAWQETEAQEIDPNRKRELRALVEQARRQIGRLTVLPAGKAFPFTVNLWRLGDAWWIVVPGELYQTFQMTFRRRFPRQPIVVATLTGDWQPGYLPAAGSYGVGIYQDAIAAVAPGSLEVLIEAIAQRIV